MKIVLNNEENEEKEFAFTGWNIEFEEVEDPNFWTVKKTKNIKILVHDYDFPEKLVKELEVGEWRVLAGKVKYINNGLPTFRAIWRTV